MVHKIDESLKDSEVVEMTFEKLTLESEDTGNKLTMSKSSINFVSPHKKQENLSRMQEFDGNLRSWQFQPDRITFVYWVCTALAGATPYFFEFFVSVAPSLLELLTRTFAGG